MEGISLGIIRAIFDKCATYIIMNGEKLKSFHLQSGARQGCPLLTFNIAWEGLVTAIRKKK